MGLADFLVFVLRGRWGRGVRVGFVELYRNTLRVLSGLYDNDCLRDFIMALGRRVY